MTQRGYDFFDEDFLARLQRLRLIAKRLAARSPVGARRSRRLGDGLEFADHRDYSPGDEVRFIDWPYYARMEKLLVRLFHEHSEADVAILLDVSASMAPGGAVDKFNYARRAAAALAYVAMGAGQYVLLQPFADELHRHLRAGRNRARIFGVLDFLAALRPAGQTRLADCTERFVRRQGSAGTVLLVSDLLDCRRELRDALARLSMLGCQTVVLHTYSPADASPALTGQLLLHQVETHQRMNLRITEDVLESYRRAWTQLRRDCSRACLARGAIYVATPTDRPFEQLMLKTLKRAGVLTG